MNKDELIKLKEEVESAKDTENSKDLTESQVAKKMTEDDFKIYMNGTYVEPQITTEYCDSKEINGKTK